MSAYSYYVAQQYPDAISSAQRFLTIHPGNKDAPYALYLIALNYYEQIEDVNRDQSITQQALDSLGELIRRYPDRRFVWLMGADNLAQFHRWRDWRRIAALVPIAVVARPGYDGAAHRAPAMGWLRRFVRPADQARNWTRWRTPALVLLELPPDPTSATGLRAADPHWHLSYEKSFNPKALRDGVTRRPLF